MKIKTAMIAMIFVFSMPWLAWGTYPTTLTNAIDGETEMVAAHLNNLEAKVGINNSSVATSLDYMLRHGSSIDPGHKHTPPYGGTGIYTYAIGDLLYASSTSALSRLAGVATGNTLISGGVGTAPAWGKVALTTHISGVLPVANGGTNIASYTIGDLLYASATGVLSKLPDVAVGQVLVSGGVGDAPAWSASPTFTGTVKAAGFIGIGVQVPHLINKVASANLRNSHDAEATSVATAYTKAKTITLTNGLVGQQRFLFDIKTAGGAATAYGKIYRNGVALGTEQTDITGGYVTKSEDITQTWNPGDTCELWVKTSNAGQIVSVQNFRIAYDDAPTVAVAGANS